MKLHYFLILFLSQICSAQTYLVSNELTTDSTIAESTRHDETHIESANNLSEDCKQLLEENSLDSISYDKFIGFAGGRGLWQRLTEECGVSIAVDSISEYERLNPQLTREKTGWVRLSLAKLYLYDGQRDKALHAFERAIISPEPTLENSEVPAAFYLGSAWNHFVRAYIAVTEKDKEKLLEVREQLSKGTKVFGQIPYLEYVDALIYRFDSY